MQKMIFIFLFLFSSAQAQMAPKLIIGDLDWTNVGQLAPDDPMRIAAGPIAYLSFSRLILSSRCTGFMVTDDILMTNHHCIKSRLRARNLKAYFRYQSDEPRYESKMAECTEFLGSNEELDYSLVRCQGRPGRTYGKVSFAQRVEPGQPIYIVQQNCDYHTNRFCAPTKKVATGEVVLLQGNNVFHNVDTLGGSSGSPVFDEQTNRVIALHRGGVGQTSPGRGRVNVAISIQEIRADIQRRFPSLAREIFRN